MIEIETSAGQFFSSIILLGCLVGQLDNLSKHRNFGSLSSPIDLRTMPLLIDIEILMESALS